MAEVTLYVVPGCPLCEDVRQILKAKRVTFRERDVENDFGAFRAMVKLTRQRLVPVVEIDGRAIVRPTAEELEW